MVRCDTCVGGYHVLSSSHNIRSYYIKYTHIWDIMGQREYLTDDVIVSIDFFPFLAECIHTCLMFVPFYIHMHE